MMRNKLGLLMATAMMGIAGLEYNDRPSQHKCHSPKPIDHSAIAKAEVKRARKAAKRCGR